MTNHINYIQYPTMLSSVKLLLFIGCMALMLTGCEQPVTLDLRQAPAKTVIEAQVTNQFGRQYVKVSRTTDFYAKGKAPRVTNATVTVSDSEGSQISFVHNPNNHPDSMGFYLPAVPFKGKEGVMYSLRVEADGEVYEGRDQLLSVIAIDSLKYRQNDSQARNPRKAGKIFELLMYAREPQDEVNFYLFKFFRNDSLTLFNNTDIYFSNDDLLAERIDGVPSPVFYGKGDKARVEVYSLTRAGYVYYNDLWSLLNTDAGGMFGSVPSTPRTNLTNGALGFFQVSALHTSSLTVE
jgi:hypothetical protein